VTPDILRHADAELERAERLLSAAPVAKRLSVQPETVRAWCRAKRLDHIRTPAGGYRISTSALDALLEKKDADFADSWAVSSTRAAYPAERGDSTGGRGV
jgi:excisionase family DNA binding protein